jgi:hypothetical protein
MRDSRTLLLLVLLVLSVVAFPLLAEEFSITPSSGPAAGGTEVRITGSFAEWPYGVYFGGVPAKSTTRIDEHTLVAVTPAHLPGVSDIRIFEYDIFLGTNLKFTFTGDVPADGFERILAPVFLPTVFGAFGSEFRSDLQLIGKNTQVQVFGLEQECIVTCIRPDPRDWPVDVGATSPETFVPNGTPGRFFYVPQAQAKFLAGNLRASDVSRSASNFGTEIPLVQERDFDPFQIVLPGIPTDPRFRSTLRIYAPVETSVWIDIDGRETVLAQLLKPEGADIFTPAYAVFTNFPIGSGQVKVTINVEALVGPSPPIYIGGPIWAFVSVTNNDTQMITTITPQP